MSAPLPTPFLSPVFSPFSPSPDSNHHELDSEHHDSHHHHHHHHRKRERVKSFVKHLASPFASPSPPPAHHHPETESPPSPTVSLSPELGQAPSILRKRESGSSVRSVMKTPPSPTSSLSSAHFPSHDISKLNPNPNHSNPEIDSNGSPVRKRERVRSFVKGIRSTSSQLFKKDKKDGDSKKSAISALVSDSISVSTAATAPHILRRLSHSGRPSTTSIITVATTATTESDPSTGYSETMVGSGEVSIGSPIIEVDTPVSPIIIQPSPLNQIDPVEEENVASETEHKTIQSFPSLNDPSQLEAASQPTEPAEEDPDPLQFPLPTSPPPSTSHLTDPSELIQTSVNEPEVEATTGNDVTPHGGEATYEEVVAQKEVVAHEKVSTHGGVVGHDDEPTHGKAPAHDNAHKEVSTNEDAALHNDVAHDDNSLITPPASQASQPPLTSPSLPIPGSYKDKEDQETSELCVPVVIPPMLFWPISNMRLTFFFTPVLIWWLSKDVVNYPSLYS